MTGEPRRKEIPEIPYEALREAIINAVAHRDYFATFKRPKIKEAIVIPEIFNLKFDEMLRDEGVKVRLRKEIAYLNIYKYIIRTEVEKLFNISTATAERDLMILKKLGLIIFKGAPKAGKYILTDKGKEIIGNIAN